MQSNKRLRMSTDSIKIHHKRINKLLQIIFEKKLIMDPVNTIMHYIKEYPNIIIKSRVNVAPIAYFHSLSKHTKKLIKMGCTQYSNNYSYRSVLIQALLRRDVDMINFMIKHKVKMRVKENILDAVFSTSNYDKRLFKQLYRIGVIYFYNIYPYGIITSYKKQLLDYNNLTQEISSWINKYNLCTLLKSNIVTETFDNKKGISKIKDYHNLLQIILINTTEYNEYNQKVIEYIAEHMSWTQLYEINSWYQTVEKNKNIVQPISSLIIKMAIEKQKGDFVSTTGQMTLIAYLNNHYDQHYGITILTEIADYYGYNSLLYDKAIIVKYINDTHTQTETIINDKDYSHVKNSSDLIGINWSSYTDENIFVTTDNYAFSSADIEHMSMDKSVSDIINPYTQKAMVTEFDSTKALSFTEWVDTLLLDCNPHKLFFETYNFEQIHYIYMTHLKEKLYKLITSDDSFSYFEMNTFDIITENTVKYIWEDISYPFFGHLGHEISFENYSPITVYEFYTSLSHIISNINNVRKKYLMSSYLYVYFQMLNNTSDEETLYELALYRNTPWDFLTFTTFAITISPLLIMSYGDP